VLVVSSPTREAARRSYPWVASGHGA
jgi:hypothetical protein